jgi:hypothetical protein
MTSAIVNATIIDEPNGPASLGESERNTMPEYREPKFEHLYDMHADLEAPQVIGAGPMGVRQIFIVKGGTVEGPKVRGTVLPGGGDWATMRTDGAVQLDVRATVKTDDGAMIYATYSGLIHGPQDRLAAAMMGQEVSLEEYYFFANPMFQTGSEQYAWLNRLLAIGRGRVVAGGVEYRVWGVS